MIISKIHNTYKKLTSTERNIADYILANPQKITHMTASNLAAECKTVPSAVIRFCKSVGTKGFSDFKIALAGDINKKENCNVMLSFRIEDTQEDIFKKVFNSAALTLSNTLEMIDFDNTDKIAHCIFNAKRILIFGLGTSSVIANDAQYRFSQLGLNVYAYTDVLYMNVAAINASDDDVIIGISHSGETKSVVDAVRSARSMGAKTIAITSFSKSSLANECDNSIIVYSDEENYPVEAVSARIAHFCIIDALMMILASMKYDDFEEYIERRNKVLKNIRY